MTETVGGVSYSVDVDYGDLNQLDAKIDQVGKSAKQSFGGIDYTVKKAQASMGNLNKTSAAVSNAFKVQKGAAQQLSFQLQDVVVQAQMGTSAFTIIAQQAPQILSLAGAGGALLGVIVALAAAAGGVLFKSFSDSSSAADDLEETMKRLDNTISDSEDGVKVLSDEFERLAKVSNNVAAAQIVIGMNDARKAIKEAGDAITESFGSDFGFTGLKDLVDIYAGGRGIQSFRAFNEIIKETGEELGFAGGQAEKVGRNVFDLLVAAKSSGTPQAIDNLQRYLGDLVVQSDGANTKLTEFVGGLTDFFSQARTAAEAVEFLTQAQKDLDSALSKSTKSGAESSSELEKLISNLRETAFTYGMSERGAALYNAEQLKATDTQKALINAYYDAIEAAEQDIETKKKSREKTADQVKEFDKLKEKLSEQILELQDSEAALEAYIQKQRDLAVSTGRNADEIESLIRLQRQLKEEQKQQKVDKKRDDRVARLEEEIRLQQVKLALGNDEFEIQSAIAALGKDATAGEVERITALITQMQALRLEAELIGPALQQSFNQTVLSGLDQLSQGLANIILNGASARDVIGNLAGTIATELLSSIIRYYAGQAAAAVLGIGAATTAGTAQAAALTAAYTPAAIAANIATFGAAATAAAATAPIAATATIGAISSGSLGGGRLYGGPVSAGKMYPITENGKPEILQQGAKQYLLPGSKGGNVVSNRDMQQSSGGMNVQINVQNNTPSNVDVQRRQGPDKTEIIDIVVADIKGRGRTLRAITDTTTASNKL